MGALLSKMIFKQNVEETSLKAENVGKELWDLEVTDISGATEPLRKVVAGMKAVLFVNFASKCGLAVRDLPVLIELHRLHHS